MKRYELFWVCLGYLALAPQTEPLLAADPLPVRNGIDVARADNFSLLAGQRVGVISNHTGIAADGTSIVELLHRADNVNLVTIFSPEHGFLGKLDQAIVADSKDKRTGLQIVSLYGEHRRPTAEMLRGIDTLVFDIQDIGARFYTYISTMGEAMQAAAEQDLRFVVLDRPNPINGVDVEGPVLDEGLESFVGFHPIAVRHGMTAGELARMFNRELELGLDLEVVQVEGWNRRDYYEATGLLWVNPSPNMRNLNEAVLYPAIGLLETTNLSVGRGTDTPFELFGAPWLDGQQLAISLNQAKVPGVRFVPIEFVPSSSKFAGETCQGCYITIIDRSTFQPLRTCWEIAHRLMQHHADNWKVDASQRLLCDRDVLAAIRAGKTAEQIQAVYENELAAFKNRRSDFLLYD